MRKTVAPLGVLLALVLAAAPARAGDGLVSLPRPGEFAFEPHAGTAIGVGGTFVKSATEVLSQSTSVGGLVFSTALGFETERRDFADVFEKPLQAGVDLSYGLTEATELFGGLSFVWAEGKKFDVMNFTFTGTLGGVPVAVGSAMTGEFDDYEEFAASLGLRRFFRLDREFKPFIAGELSVRRVDSLNINLSHEPSGAGSEGATFYDASIAYGAGVRAGFRYDAWDAVAISVEAGLTYKSELRGDDNDLAGFSTLVRSNDDGDILEIPVSVRATIRF